MRGRQLLLDWIERSKIPTHAEVAQYLGLDRGDLSRILTGKRVPGLTNAVELQRLTGVPVISWTENELDESATTTAGDGKTARIDKAQR